MTYKWVDGEIAQMGMLRAVLKHVPSLNMFQIGIEAIRVLD